MMKRRTRLAVPLGFFMIVMCLAAGMTPVSAPQMQSAVASAMSRYQGPVCAPRRTSTGSRSLRSWLHVTRGPGPRTSGQPLPRS